MYVWIYTYFIWTLYITIQKTNKKPLYSSPKIMASAYPVFKFSRFRLGVRVPSFHNFGNLGGQLESRYDDARSEK